MQAVGARSHVIDGRTVGDWFRSIVSEFEENGAVSADRIDDIDHVVNIVSIGGLHHGGADVLEPAFSGEELVDVAVDGRAVACWRKIADVNQQFYAVSPEQWSGGAEPDKPDAQGKIDCAVDLVETFGHEDQAVAVTPPDFCDRLLDGGGIVTTRRRLQVDGVGVGGGDVEG